MKRLQEVLAAMSDEEAMAVWHALSAHVENVSADSFEDEHSVLEPLVERLDVVVADLCE
jgi:hypothetical protein